MQLYVTHAKWVIYPVYLDKMLEFVNAKMMMIFAIHGFIVLVKKNFLFHIISFFLGLIGTELAVQRDCMSITSSEYLLIKEMIGNRVKGCVKHPRTLDCFSYCSGDLCNWTSDGHMNIYIYIYILCCTIFLSIRINK